MNSFMQALFITDAFVWRIYAFSLKLKAEATKMDEEDFEFGKKVVELLQKLFAKMALTKLKHTDIWDILQAFPADYRSGAHLCLCLNRFTFNMESFDFTKEKTPVKIDESLWIGGYEYERYHAIIHSGKDASSGHYYAMGR